MPYWDPQYALRQIKAGIRLTRGDDRGASRSHASLGRSQEARCGCCPRCRAFVRIPAAAPGIAVPCPACGQFIAFVRPPEDEPPPLE